MCLNRWQFPQAYPAYLEPISVSHNGVETPLALVAVLQSSNSKAFCSLFKNNNLANRIIVYRLTCAPKHTILRLA